MPFGPGKYDDLCTLVREKVGIGDDGDEGGVLVIVISKEHGNGFSCQADLKTTAALPELLEAVARAIRAGGH